MSNVESGTPGAGTAPSGSVHRGWWPAALHARLAGMVAALALCALAGWLFHRPILTTFVPGRAAMTPMAALGLLLAAQALACVHAGPGARWLAVLQSVLGGVVVLAHLCGVAPPGTDRPSSWASLPTGVALVSSGTATWLLAAGRTWEGQALALLTLLVAALVGLGHLVPGADLYRYLPGSAGGVAVPTVLAFVALSVGQLLSYGDAGIMAALTARSMVGRAGRRLLAVGLALPLLLALLLLAGYRQRLLDAETAMMVVSWGTLALLAGAVWGLAIAVDRAELARGLAERQRNSLRQMLVAALSHDLRSPLQVATLSMSALQWLDGNERSHALKRTQQSLGRIDRLLHSLLDSLAVDSGKPLALRPVALELVALVRQVVAEHEARLDGRVRIEGAPVHGWWDHDALFRVVENLLLNAAKYGTAGGAIECALRPMEGERVCLTVRNGGPAIPPAEWELIFQPFSRGAGAQQSGQIGWGVGLAYARAVITRHGGSIRVDSSDQRGTTFAVTLPLDARRHQ